MAEVKSRHIVYSDLLKPHLKSLENTANRMAKNRQEAEDLLQETLYLSYRSFYQFKKNTNFRAWIFRILVNLYITNYKKMQRRPNNLSFEDTKVYYLYKNRKNKKDNLDLFFSELSFEQFNDTLSDALQRLPEIYRTVVLLRDVDQYNYREISEIANIPVGTVMSRLHRARNMLRKSLKKYAMKRGYSLKARFNKN